MKLRRKNFKKTIFQSSIMVTTSHLSTLISEQSGQSLRKMAFNIQTQRISQSSDVPGTLPQSCSRICHPIKRLITFRNLFRLQKRTTQYVTSPTWPNVTESGTLTSCQRHTFSRKSFHSFQKTMLVDMQKRIFVNLLDHHKEREFFYLTILLK